MFANSGDILIGKHTAMSIPFYESTKAILLKKTNLLGLAPGYFMTVLQYIRLFKSIFTTPDFENSRWVLY